MNTVLNFQDFINEVWKVDQSRLANKSQNSVDRNVISKLFDTPVNYYDCEYSHISNKKDDYTSSDERYGKLKNVISKQDEIYFDKIYNLLNSYGYEAIDCFRNKKV